MKTLGIFVSCLLAVILVWAFTPESLKLRLQELSSVTAYRHNTAGARAFHDKDMGLAISEWAEALSVNPSEEKIHFNMGLALQVLKRGEDAEKAYQIVLKSADKTAEEQFLTEFNLGTLHGENKDIDKALEHYQAALDINPTSKETKINIELLIQQGGKGDGKGEGEKKPQDGEGEKKPEDGEGEGEDKPKEYAPNQKPQKPQFKSEELTPSDVNKILGEIKQQEQRIRSEYSKKDPKEGKRDKDW